MKIAKFIAAVLCTPQNNLHCLSAKSYLQSEYCNQNFSTHKIYTFQFITKLEHHTGYACETCASLSMGTYFISMGTYLASLLDGNNKYPFYLCLTVQVKFLSLIKKSVSSFY